MLDSSLTWLILIPYLHPYEESFFSHLYLGLCFGAAGRKLIAHNILSWWKHFTRFSGHNLHSGGYKSCAASAAEMASDCYQLAFNAPAQTTRVRKNFTLLCKISSFRLSLRSFSLFLRGAAVRPSLVPLVSSSSSPTLLLSSSVGVTPTSALLSWALLTSSLECFWPSGKRQRVILSLLPSRSWYPWFNK